MSGWIKIHRQIKDHWLYTEKRKFSKYEAWNDILLSVNYADATTIIKGKLYKIKKGESILSLDSWSKRWNWDKSSVRRFLSLLQKDGMIVLKSDTITTHLTICKWDEYQVERNADATQTKHKRNARETQTTPIKEEEEIKEEKEVLLDEWISYRKQIKKTLTSASIEKLKNEMTLYSNEKCKFVINTSISNGWQGLFWDKYTEQPKQQKKEFVFRNGEGMTQEELNQYAKDLVAYRLTQIAENE
jgi:hypothetical protein